MDICASAPDVSGLEDREAASLAESFVTEPEISMRDLEQDFLVEDDVQEDMELAEERPRVEDVKVTEIDDGVVGTVEFSDTCDVIDTCLLHAVSFMCVANLRQMRMDEYGKVRYVAGRL